MARAASVSFALGFTVTTALSGCTVVPERETVFVGPNVRVDLVVVFRRDAPIDSVDQFPTTVLMRPDGHGGFIDPPGLQSMSNGHEVQGYRVMSLGFHDDATSAQRAAIRSSLTRSPLVYLVVPDTAPTQLSLPQPRD
jgi:hypothetical protein